MKRGSNREGLCSWVTLAALAVFACSSTTDERRGVVGTARYATTLAPTWFDRTTSVSPSTRKAHAMAFDAARGEVVLFGGEFGGGSYFGDTWIWNGSTWRQVVPSQSPSARRDHAMTFDAARGEIVLFGGRDVQGAFADTWVWNGSTWSLRTPTTKPPARSAFGMANDEARREVLVFGGSGASANLNDTWAWNGSTWSAKTSSTKPAARMAPAMAYDGLLQGVVLFGGVAGTATFGDTWFWSGTAWSQKAPATSPTARSGASGVFDAARWETLALFGAAGATPRADVWAWSGSTWANRTPTVAVASPPARSGQGAAYDSVRRETIIFGGHDGTRHRNDTWAFRAPECAVDADCRDNLACTTDTCVGGACVHDVAPASCALGGACYASGVKHPANPCAACEPTVSRTAWSAEPAGTVCAGGICDGVGNCRPFSDAGAALPDSVANPSSAGSSAAQPLGAYDDGARRSDGERLPASGAHLNSVRADSPRDSPSDRAQPLIATDSFGCHVGASPAVHGLLVFVALALPVVVRIRRRP